MRKRSTAQRGEALSALIECLADSLWSACCWRDTEEAWLSCVTVLLRLCAVRLTHPAEGWHILLNDFSVLLTAPTTLQTEIPSRSVQALDQVALRAVDALLPNCYVKRGARSTGQSPAVEAFAEPAPVLTRVYEEVLNMVPAFDSSRPSGSKLRALVRDRSKKRAGAFYSPPDLVSQVVQNALASLVRKTDGPLTVEDLRILDPAMGAGAFLIQVLKYLRKHSTVDAETLARKVLYGVDLDPLAVEVARLSLWVEVGNYSLNPQVEFPNLRVGNSLIGCRLDQVRKEENLEQLKDRLDSWCRVWFQPEHDSEVASEVQSRERARQKFFHWEFEFPEVFSRDVSNAGFDAVIGNPPWEIEKPNSREFFGAVVPNYWTLSKPDAIAAQKQLLSSEPNLAAAWLERRDSHKRFAKWVRKAPVQCTEGVHPFLCQGGGDMNMYKLFCEQSFYLARKGGLVSLVVPSGIYSDSGARDLRRMMIERNHWAKLVGFENSARTFDIHRSFKFCFFVAIKGGTTDFIETNFGGQTCRQDAAALGNLSPRWSVLPEVESRAVFSLIEKIYSAAQFLGATENGGMTLDYKREFDMTMDCHFFRARDELETGGYRQDCYGNWLLGDWRACYEKSPPDRLDEQIVLSPDRHFFIDLQNVEDLFIPLYEGRMVGQFDSNQKSWMSGRGRRAVWVKTVSREVSGRAKSSLGPQYLVSRDAFLQRCSPLGLKIGFLAVGSATNARTMIAAALSAVACGNSVPVLNLAEPGVGAPLSRLEYTLALTACLNSFVFDYVIRRRMAGNNLNYFVIEECPIPALNEANKFLWKQLALLSGMLSLTSLRYCREILAMGLPLPETDASSELVAKRQNMRVLTDLIVAKLYGLNGSDMRVLLSGSSSDDLKFPKAFFRMDRDLSAEMRLPAMVAKASNLLEARPDEFESTLEARLSDFISKPVASDLAVLKTHAQVLNALVQ
jgi:hypothetical protein